jgi:hypothetical protein
MHVRAWLVQAGVVAESPYYKMLIGRALGYSEANILYHIKARSDGCVLGSWINAHALQV